MRPAIPVPHRPLTIDPTKNRRAFEAWIKAIPEAEPWRIWQTATIFATVAHADGVDAALAILEGAARA